MRNAHGMPPAPRSVQAEADRIGDGPGYGGFYDVIRKATWLHAAVDPSGAGDDAFFAALRAEILAAPRSASRSATSVEKYAAIAEIRRLTAAARERQQAPPLPAPPL